MYIYIYIYHPPPQRRPMGPGPGPMAHGPMGSWAYRPMSWYVYMNVYHIFGRFPVDFGSISDRGQCRGGEPLN